MPDDKPPYKLVITLSSARPDSIGEALKQIRDIAADQDLLGNGEGKIVFESFRDRDLKDLADAIELYLADHQLGMESKMRLDRPGIRPEWLAVHRARHTTPMDKTGWEQKAPETDDQAEADDDPGAPQVIVTPYRQPLMLEAPVEEGLLLLEAGD